MPLQPELPLGANLSLCSPDHHARYRHHPGARVWLAGRGGTERVLTHQPTVPERVWSRCVDVVQRNSDSAAMQSRQVPAQSAHACRRLRGLHLLQQLPGELPVQGAEGAGDSVATRLHGGEGEGPDPHPRHLEPLCVCPRAHAAQAQLFPQRDVEGC